MLKRICSESCYNFPKKQKQKFIINRLKRQMLNIKIMFTS